MNGRRVDYCRCKEPARSPVLVEGRVVCDNCGNIVPDPALVALAGQLSKLRGEIRQWEPPQPRLALNRKEAAAMLGMHPETFKKIVLPKVKVVRFGRELRIPVAELERYLAEESALTVDGAR